MDKELFTPIEMDKFVIELPSEFIEKVAIWCKNHHTNVKDEIIRCLEELIQQE